MTFIAPVPTAGGKLVWEWDGLTLNQFAGSPTPAHQSATTAGLSVVANATNPGGYILRFNMSTTPAGGAHFLVNDPMPSSNMMWEIEANNRHVYGGVCFFGDVSGSYHGYSYEPSSSAGWRHRVDAGSFVTGGATGNNLHGTTITVPGFMRIWMFGEKPGGAQPRFAVGGESARNIGGPRAWLLTGGWASEPAPASWNSLVCNRWGLSAQMTAGTSSYDWDIRALRAYDLDQ
jgi:hypothetical protein